MCNASARRIFSNQRFIKEASIHSLVNRVSLVVEVPWRAIRICFMVLSSLTLRTKKVCDLVHGSLVNFLRHCWADCVHGAKEQVK